MKKVFLKIRKIDKKTPVTESLFNNIEGLRPAKIKNPIQVFSVSFTKFLRTPCLQNNSRRLLWIGLMVKKFIYV